MIIIQQKASDIIMFSAETLKYYALSILKKNHKAESNIQLCPTLSEGKMKLLNWDANQTVYGT